MARIQWPGVVGPALTTPQRRPRSVRRTITIDGFRPDGPMGDVEMTSRGRDLVTAADGTSRVLVAGEVFLRAGPEPDYRLIAISSELGGEGLARLVGVPTTRGFRKGLREVLDGASHDTGSLAHALLDDVPIISTLSRLAVLQNNTYVSPSRGDRSAQFGICSGWRVGGSMAVSILSGGRGAMTEGVLEPAGPDDADPDGWHAVPTMPTLGFRRRRQIDVAGPDGSGQFSVDGSFRDTYVNDEGEHLIMHEYSVAAVVDGASRTLVQCTATPRVLPAAECHLAAAKVARLIGANLDDVGTILRIEMEPEDTCTHLTDHLRALADIAALIDQVPVG